MSPADHNQIIYGFDRVETPFQVYRRDLKINRAEDAITLGEIHTPNPPLIWLPTLPVFFFRRGMLLLILCVVVQVASERALSQFFSHVLAVFVIGIIILSVSAFVIPYLFSILQFLWRKRRYEPKQYLVGRLTSIKRFSNQGDIYIDVDYQFIAPDGRLMSGKVVPVRNDLIDQPLPPPGTPIQIVYINPKNFRPV